MKLTRKASLRNHGTRVIFDSHASNHERAIVQKFQWNDDTSELVISVRSLNGIHELSLSRQEIAKIATAAIRS